MRIIYIYIYIDVRGGFLKWGIPKTVDFNTQVVIQDLDDLLVPSKRRHDPSPFLSHLSTQ